MDTRDVHRYIEVTHDPEVYTLDQVMSLTGWSKEKTIEAHNEAVALLNHVSGVELLTQLWDISNDMHLLRSTIKDCRRDLLEIKDQPYSPAHKELRSQFLAAHKEMVSRQREFEEILASIRERENVEVFVKSIVRSLGEIDPVLATKVRTLIVEQATVFAAYLDQLGPPVEKVEPEDLEIDGLTGEVDELLEESHG